MNLTTASIELFKALVADAPNWSGEPMVDLTPARRGNLTQLKKAGFLTTFVDNGIAFCQFTEAGRAYAKANNFRDADCL